MAHVEEISDTGTTGRNESILYVRVVEGERRTGVYVSFIPESGKMRPDLKCDAELDDAEKAALLAWVDHRWPGNDFLAPPDWRVFVKPAR